MKMKIFRYDKKTQKPRYDVFEIDPTPGMTVLGALFYIRNNLDDSLSFRYSCRGAVCGICALQINNVPRLACRTQISSLLEGTAEIQLRNYQVEVKEKWDSREEVLVEPLHYFTIIKDLVVDKKRFFDLYNATQPVFKPADEPPERERLMDPEAVKELENYTNCILCAACVSSCPVNLKNPEYIGPASLAKLYRFHIDPRESEDDSRVLLMNNKAGWWACEFHGNCRRVCPKGVPPIIAIGKARGRIDKIGKVPTEFSKK